jgi:hypothetical protein
MATGERPAGQRLAPSIRARLLGLVAAIAIPGLVGAPLFLDLVYRRERAQLEQALQQTARALAQALDRELGLARAGAEALAASRSFSQDDLPGMYRRAVEFARLGINSNYVLTDPGGQQVFNTLRPLGEPLPRHGSPELVRRVLETGAPAISDVFQGGVLRRPVMSVDVPVRREGRIAYVLSAGLLPERLGEILSRQQLPPGDIGAIFDSQGTIAARTHRAEQLVGQRAAAAVLEALGRQDEGVIESPTLEGIPAHIAFSRAPVSRWTVAIATPTATLLRALRHDVALLGLGALALVAVVAGLAWALAGQMARAVRALVAPARALGSGEPVEVPRLAIREADEVAGEMASAARLLRERTEERDRAVDSERVSQELAAERKRQGDLLRDALARNEQLVAELREALQNNKTLAGLLPLCAWCHKVRDDEGYWQRIEAYVGKHTDARVTHALCPECYAKVGPRGQGEP